MRSLFRFLFVVVAILVTHSAALSSCFRTDNYTAVRGTPFTLTWSVDGNDFVYDISIATEDKQGLGYIARNVTQDSLIWTPPLEIKDGPYRYSLFNYNRQSTCYSDQFNVTGDSGASSIELDGPQVTSAVTLNGQRELVTATVGAFTPKSTSATDTTELPSLSTTSASEPTNTSADPGSNSSPNNSGPTDAGLAIGLGVAFGVLALVSLVLVILFLRIKRKTSERKDAAANLTPSEEDRAGAAYTPSLSHAGLGELGTAANTAELGGYEKMAELEASSSGQNSPVELPGESVSAEWQRAIRRCDSTSKS